MMTVKQIVSTERLGAWVPFVINLTLIIAIFIGAIYTGIFLNSGVMIESELHSRASAIFNSIVLARKWNTQYGGVYVEKTPACNRIRILRTPMFTGSTARSTRKRTMPS